MEKVFNKQISYQCDNINSWTLPPIGHLFTDLIWEDDCLQSMKKELNDVKELLSDKDINEWHNHTQFMHCAGKVISHLQHHIQPELCTQAWSKFYEIVSTFPIVPRDAHELLSLHICEAPGAFITSLNHYIKSNPLYMDWTWVGNSLNPYYEGNSLSYMIDNDTFIRNTLDCWYFGPNNDGDITSKENIEHLHHHFDGEKVELVTADGSFNCQNHPADQEKIVAFLQFCEVVAACSILKDNGSFVFKMFTAFEAESVCLMYLLNCLFSQVSFFKPATSKPGNSEVYVVCLCFKGIPLDYLKALIDAISTGALYLSRTIFRLEDIPKSFLKQHICCCKFVVDHQISTIKENLSTYKVLTCDEQKLIESHRDQCVQYFIEQFHVKRIANVDMIVSRRAQKNKRGQQRFSHERLLGTYNYRMHLISSPWKVRVANMVLNKDEDQKICRSQHGFSFLSAENSHIKQWSFVYGKPVMQIKSSKFCSQQLLDEYNELFDNSKELLALADGKNCCVKTVCENIKLSAFKNCINRRFNITDINPGHSEFVEQLSALLNCEETDLPLDSTSILFADATCKSNGQVSIHVELQSMPELLSTFTKSLTLLENNGHLIIKMHSSYTRFSIGLIWVMSRAFQEVMIDKFGEPSDNIVQYIVCLKYLGIAEEIFDYLNSAEKDMLGGSHMLLQFIPIREMLDPQFFSFITDANNKNLVKYVNSLIVRNKRRYGFGNG